MQQSQHSMWKPTESHQTLPSAWYTESDPRWGWSRLTCETTHPSTHTPIAGCALHTLLIQPSLFDPPSYLLSVFLQYHFHLDLHGIILVYSCQSLKLKTSGAEKHSAIHSSMGSSIHPSICPSVCPSIHNMILWYNNDVMYALIIRSSPHSG